MGTNIKVLTDSSRNHLKLIPLHINSYIKSTEIQHEKVDIILKRLNVFAQRLILVILIEKKILYNCISAINCGFTTFLYIR